MPVSAPVLSAAPKGSLVDFRLTPAEIAGRVEETIRKERELLDEVAQEESPMLANVIAPLGHFSASLAVEGGVASLLGSVAVDEEARGAGNQAKKLKADFEIERTMREDVYKVVRAVYDNKDEMDKLDPEDRRLVEKMELKHRRAGLLLSSEKREQLRDIKKRESVLEVDFRKCINDEDARLLFSRDELEGLPEDYFNGRETEDHDGEAKYVVTSKYPDYIPLMKYAKRESTRKAMLIADENRCPDNIPRLQELVKLRLEQAQLLGYNTYSEYALEVLMAKTPQAALDMEEDLLAR
ncbi:metalloendopeptidase, partial [Coemansia biformis]